MQIFASWNWFWSWSPSLMKTILPLSRKSPQLSPPQASGRSGICKRYKQEGNLIKSYFENVWILFNPNYVNFTESISLMVYYLIFEIKSCIPLRWSICCLDNQPKFILLRTWMQANLPVKGRFTFGNCSNQILT